MCIDHPNFEEVIEMNIRPSMSVLAAEGQVRAAPILIYGDPGVGKSYFFQRVAKILRSPFTKVDMAATQSGSSLIGSSAFWANTDPGRVFNTLIFGTDGIPATIDPILFLDEIDKTSADRYGALAGLYSFQEIESTKQLEDESYPGLSLNAPYIR
jgi:ATP-dependent Lon protease